MLEFIEAHQLSFMLFLSGVCFILAILALLTRTLSAKRRRILVSLELSAMLLLIFDRYAYLFRGDLSDTGFWMVRISNLMVFLLTIFLTHSFNLYLIDLCLNEGGLEKPPRRLLACEALFFIGSVLIVISQFTGIYYYFDELNLYHRSPGFAVCFTIPLIILILQLTVIIQYRFNLRRRIVFSLLLFSLVPLGASILQLFVYGVSFINISLVGMAVILYIFALLDLNDSLEKAKTREIDLLKSEQKKIHIMFEQTAEALASAIDAKDTYTSGHSSRVADYAEAIARSAGMSESECEEIFFAALLHDVGKIGVPNDIINKPGRLTKEEYEVIKEHPVMGSSILSSISESPYLSEGAHFHHEQYDGSGYPSGLRGNEIPALARILAVADAYDAMTSKRSYRNPLPQAKVREEIVNGSGTQFDPKYADIMIRLIDADTEYRMRESDAASL